MPTPERRPIPDVPNHEIDAEGGVWATYDGAAVRCPVSAGGKCVVFVDGRSGGKMGQTLDVPAIHKEVFPKATPVVMEPEPVVLEPDAPPPEKLESAAAMPDKATGQGETRKRSKKRSK